MKNQNAKERKVNREWNCYIEPRRSIGELMEGERVSTAAARRKGERGPR